MVHVRPSMMRAYWSVTCVALFGAAALASVYAPVDAEMGVAQKLIYLHLPAALAALMASFSVFAAGLGYFWSRRAAWDEMGAASARAAVVFCTLVVATGLIWAKSFWGHWWAWSPRFVFTLVMLVLYVVYLGIRPRISCPQRRAMTCAVYGMIAFLDVPLVYMSVRLLPDVHPESVPLSPEMRQTLIAWFVPVMMVCVGMIGQPLVVHEVAAPRPIEPPAGGRPTHA